MRYLCKRRNIKLEKLLKKEAKKATLVEVMEVECEIEDERKIMSRRTIKEFWTLDGKYIGKLDPLDDYPLIEPLTKE